MFGVTLEPSCIPSLSLSRLPCFTRVFFLPGTVSCSCINWLINYIASFVTVVIIGGPRGKRNSRPVGERDLSSYEASRDVRNLWKKKKKWKTRCFSVHEFTCSLPADISSWLHSIFENPRVRPRRFFSSHPSLHVPTPLAPLRKKSV